jgi:hypothetical protein
MKSGCHLCAEAQTELDRLRPRYAHALECVDIQTDDELLQRYGESIPVLVVQGREYPAPLSREAIELALAEATGLRHGATTTPTKSSDLSVMERIKLWSHHARGE